MAQNKEIQVVEPLNRATIQETLTPKVKKAVEEMIADLEMPCDPDHVRRTARALVHIAAKIALENGCPLPGWAYMVQAAWAKESTHESLGDSILMVDRLGFHAQA
jgi:hypothetical protein